MSILVVKNLNNLKYTAREILNITAPNRKFVFYGEMGIGKTTLIKALSLHLGVRDIVNSPTFSIVNEYVTENKYKIYHFDFYRIKDENEAYDLGYEEYFRTNDYCFIEWPDRVPNLIEDNMVRIYMSFKQKKRLIDIKM